MIAYVFIAVCLSAELPDTRPIAGATTRASAKSVTAPKTKVVKRLVLKPSAPPAVVRWFSMLPSIKAAEVVDIQRQIDLTKAEIQRLVSLPVPSIQSGTDNFGGSSSRRDERAIQARANQIAELRKLIPVLIKRKKDTEADTLFVHFTQLEPQLDDHLCELPVFRVVQVNGPDTAIIECLGKDYWLEGVSTTGWADDTIQRVQDPVVVSGTKTFVSAMNTNRTLKLIRPMPVLPHLDVVVEEVPQ